jgi:membrane carboxypeptidase/penicillin-binding protein
VAAPALVAVAMVVALLGAGLVAGTYYYDSVQVGDPVNLPSSTVVYYADGTVLARLGQVARYPLAYDKIAENAVEATVAVEDPGFWSNRGGPIARSLARHTFDIRGDSTNARIRWVCWPGRSRTNSPRRRSSRRT